MLLVVDSQSEGTVIMIRTHRIVALATGLLCCFAVGEANAQCSGGRGGGGMPATGGPSGVGLRLNMSSPQALALQQIAYQRAEQSRQLAWQRQYQTTLQLQRLAQLRQRQQRYLAEQSERHSEQLQAERLARAEAKRALRADRTAVRLAKRNTEASSAIHGSQLAAINIGAPRSDTK